MISRKQLVTILLVTTLGVLIYLAPKMSSASKVEEKDPGDITASFEEAMKNATEDQKNIFGRLQQGLIKAQQDNSEASWLSSADDFLKGARFITDDKKAALYKSAISGFEKALELNPNNLSAKTSLGAALVESSSLLGNQPMKGISLLREVIQKDSNNVEANIQLGLFSVTSQQFDKAIERFTRVLRIDSTHIDMYVFLGETYTTMGNKEKAIESFENYKSHVTDSLIIKSIEEHIKKLKQQP